jgi:hypothetical protein
MEKRSRIFRSSMFIGLAVVFLMFVVTFLFTVPVQAQDKQGWFISSLQTSEPEICLGQQVSVYGEYDYNVGVVTGDLAPLVPLSGPEKIVTHAVIGDTSPKNLVPGLNTGSFAFDYIGTKEGQDKIVVTIIDKGETVNTKTIPITVMKKCIYSFRLVAHMISSDKSGDLSQSFQNTLKAVGKLTSDNAGNQTVLNGSTKIEVVTDYLDFTMPDCQLFTWSPGFARGSIKATADISSGILLHFQIAPPKNLDWILRTEGACDGESAAVSANIDLASLTHNDPWIEQDFLPEGGTKNIKLDIFEQGLKNCKKGTMTCSYTATLTVTREKGE